jgi:hypothetical protein
LAAFNAERVWLKNFVWYFAEENPEPFKVYLDNISLVVPAP